MGSGCSASSSCPRRAGDLKKAGAEIGFQLRLEETGSLGSSPRGGEDGKTDQFFTMVMAAPSQVMV